MIDRLAVAQRASARGVVADHASQSRPVAGRNVRPEHQAERLEMGVELVQDDTRFDTHGHRIAIDDPDPVEVLREIDNDCGADRLTGETRGGSSRQDRDAFLRRDRHGRDDVAFRPGHDDAEGFDLIEAGVG